MTRLARQNDAIVAGGRRLSASASLEELAAEIEREHAGVRRTLGEAVEHAIRAGRLLNSAKARVEHGGWQQWLKKNFSGSARSAQGYMQLADHEAKARPVAHLGLRAALEEVRVDRPLRRSDSPPSDFPIVAESTDYRCPRCVYEWSGPPKPSLNT